MVSGTESDFLLPMYAHLPGGGVGDVATGVGVPLALGCLAGGRAGGRQDQDDGHGCDDHARGSDSQPG